MNLSEDTNDYEYMSPGDYIAGDAQNPEVVAGR
jgi:hypothetical protein